jgi:OPA family sugar phosphate sensor protein UhpC-like MFS transporter
MNPILKFYKPCESAPRIEDPSEIDRTFKKYRWTTLATITLGYGLMYTTRAPLNIIKKPLLDAHLFTAQELGIIGSALLYSYAFGKCVNGFLADHANIRRFFATGMFLSALVNLMMGSTTWFLFWTILWAFNGWFQGFGAPSSVVALARWFSNKERGTFYGIWSTSHSIGEGLTFILSSAIVAHFGWRSGFIVPGIVCILGATGVYFLLAERPEAKGLPPVADWKNDHGVKRVEGAKTDASTGSLQWLVFKSPKIWILGLASAAMYTSRYAINSWGVLYLQEAKGYSLVQAGSIMGVNTIAGIAGAIGYGWISDKVFNAKRPPVTLIFGLVETAALAVVFFFPSGHPVVLTTAFAFYGFTLAGLNATLGGLFATDIMPKKVAGAALGMIGIFSYLASATQDIVSGHLIDAGKHVVDGKTVYDFSTPVVFWIIPSILSVILAASLWKAKPTD